jgi:hypothetical protein
VNEYTIKPLDSDTWDAFVQLGNKHNGVWNGCWCNSFHPRRGEEFQGWEGSREYKRSLVCGGAAHAALVFDGDTAVGWCQYGTPEELPNIYHRREYEAGLTSLPDYRITCFFVDRDYRRKRVATTALAGALDLIATSGGGVVEAYPQDAQGRKISASFLYNGTRNMFAQASFEYERPKGRNHCVMRKVVAPVGEGRAAPAR